MSVRSFFWDYDDEVVKLQLIRAAVRKAKVKAEQMMDAIGYTVVGLHSCSDSYVMPNVGEIILSDAGSGRTQRAYGGDRALSLRLILVRNLRVRRQFLLSVRQNF